MKTLEEIKHSLVMNKEDFQRQYKIKEIGIFGSYAKGKQRKKSDVDILVEFEESATLSLLDFIRLENELGEVLGVKVDLVEKQTLKPRIGKHVLAEVEMI
jgi:uncharacterized protein